MLYFVDPVLSLRARLAPPDKFWALEGSNIVKQRPLDRTCHVISKAETLKADQLSPDLASAQSEEERIAKMQGFIEELTTAAEGPSPSCK